MYLLSSLSIAIPKYGFSFPLKVKYLSTNQFKLDISDSVSSVFIALSPFVPLSTSTKVIPSFVAIS